MKIGDALRGVNRLYIETAPFIYYVEENPRYIAKMDAKIEFVDKQHVTAISSVITLAEVLSQPIKMGNKKIEQEYRDILTKSRNYTLLPITIPVAENTAQLRARYGLRTPDALHIASAIDAGCDAFLSNDAGMKRVTELTILFLDDLEV